ncbi:hypothetical protein ACFWJY_36875 [Streptomyces anulatus]|uniref:hypothetical protein n=1 Tax=Streptomyces anulatus TaxID=1892 RepID=UPI00365612AA
MSGTWTTALPGGPRGRGIAEVSPSRAGSPGTTSRTPQVEAQQVREREHWLGLTDPADNDPVEQEKAMKFNALLTNAVIFHHALDIAEIVRHLPEGDGRSSRRTWPTSRRT